MSTERINVSRREFLISSSKIAGVGTAFSLGLYLPMNAMARSAVAAR